MGCDIHFYVEKYTSGPDRGNGPKDISEFRNTRISNIVGESNKNDEPRWISADNWELVKYLGEDDYWRHDELYGGRNYWLFYFLADVRYGPEWVSPNNPKGIPDDASYAYLEITKRWNGDGHSHSYFLLSELLEIDDSVWEKLESLDFITTIEKMKLIDPDPENVRCVFFFDN